MYIACIVNKEVISSFCIYLIPVKTIVSTQNNGYSFPFLPSRTPIPRVAPFRQDRKRRTLTDTCMFVQWDIRTPRHPAMTRHKWSPYPYPYAKLLATWSGSKRNPELRIRVVWDMILILSDWSTLADEGTTILQNARNKSSNEQLQNPEKSSLQQPLLWETRILQI